MPLKRKLIIICGYSNQVWNDPFKCQFFLKMSELTQPSKNVIRCAVVTSIADEAHKQWLARKNHVLREEKEKLQKKLEAEKARQLQMNEKKIQRNYECSRKVKEWQERKAKEELKKRQTHSLLTSIQQPDDEADLNEKRKEIFEKWVQLKLEKQEADKTRQEMLQKMEIRERERKKFLAATVYDGWKESAKSRKIVIPRNGFQVFGPKPKPVVVDEWVTADQPELS